MARPRIKKFDCGQDLFSASPEIVKVEPFLPFCIVCGEPGLFGFGVKLHSGRMGVWACGLRDHRNLAELRSHELSGEAA